MNPVLLRERVHADATLAGCSHSVHFAIGEPCSRSFLWFRRRANQSIVSLTLGVGISANPLIPCGNELLNPWSSVPAALHCFHHERITQRPFPHLLALATARGTTLRSMKADVFARVASILGGTVLVGVTLTGCLSSASSDTNVVGTWGDASLPQTPSLEFDGTADSGRYAGTDGCNRLMGEYTATSDGTIDLGMMASTEMYCEGVDDWLRFARTARIEATTMTLFDEEGAKIGSLVRQ